MKHIKRTRRGLVEKKTGRKIVSPLDSMVRQETSQFMNIDTRHPNPVCVTNPPRHPWKSNLDPSNEKAITVINPYGAEHRKALEQDHFSGREGRTGHPKRLGTEGKRGQRQRKKLADLE